MSEPFNVVADAREAMHMAQALGDVRGPMHKRSAECRERMSNLRSALIIQYPFFGIIACKLKLVEDNIHCPTLATDGKHMFYNVGYVMGVADEDKEEYVTKFKEAFPDATDAQIEESTKGLTDKETTFGIVHEIMHCMFEHFIRRNAREPKKWNRAADYAINQIILREMGPGVNGKKHLADIRKGPDGKPVWLFDTKYDSMTAEEIYRLLEDTPEDEQGGASQDVHPGPGQGGQGGQGGDGDGEDRGSVGDLFGHTTDAEMSDDIKGFREIVRSAAQAASNVPGDLQRMLDDVATPRIDWKTKIRRTLQSYLKRDMAFYRPSRRSWNYGCILPGFLPEETIDICIALDMSGSITDSMAKEMLGEVLGMTRQFTQFRIKLLCFDTQVYNPEDFDETTIEKLLKYRVKGGGGTDFDAVWNFMKEENYKPKQLIMFTDLYPWNSWGDPDYCETLFVGHGTTSIVPPFGQVCYYEFQNENMGS